MEENKQVRGYSNTHAQNTEVIAQTALVDWFRCTFRHADLDLFLHDIFGLTFSSFTDMQTSNYGYQYAKTYCGITVYFGGKDLEQFVVNFSGMGCRFFESRNLDKNVWVDVFKNIFELEYFSFRRLDIAIDSYDDSITCRKAINCVRRGEFVSYFKRVDENASYLANTGENVGQTLYFGNRLSRTFIRLYDKKQEQIYRKVPVQEDSWYRLEFEFKEERAEQVAKELLNQDMNLKELVLGIASDYLSFRRADPKQKNKSRWELHRWWKKFLNNASRLKLSNDATIKDLSKTKIWLQKQVSPTSVMMFLLEDLFRDEEFIHERNMYLALKDCRLGKKHLVIFNNYITKKGMNPLTEIEWYDLLQNKKAELENFLQLD